MKATPYEVKPGNKGGAITQRDLKNQEDKNLDINSGKLY
jgi:hypothetical protein